MEDDEEIKEQKEEPTTHENENIVPPTRGTAAVADKQMNSIESNESKEANANTSAVQVVAVKSFLFIIIHNLMGNWGNIIFYNWANICLLYHLD